VTYKHHPVAALFPMMNDVDLQALVVDIKKNGLREPIILHDGLILDGRNRDKACDLAAVRKRFEHRIFSSPVSYVISKNLHRRHLTVAQRAAVAVKMVPLLKKEARERQKKGTLASRESKGKAAAIAGQALGVSAATVTRAVRVSVEDPKAFDQMKEGKTSVKVAYDALPSKRERIHATYAEAQDCSRLKKKFGSTLSRIESDTTFLREVNIPGIAGVCVPGEKLALLKQADICVTGCQEVLAKIRAEIKSMDASVSAYLNEGGSAHRAARAEGLGRVAKSVVP
jgi:hypothetical protein